MEHNAFYVYALKDPRARSPKPFYIGKGTGIRAWEHDIKPDNTKKGKRITEIQSANMQILVSVLADNLTESQSLKLESELISAFGTEDTGGILTNSVVPSGNSNNVPQDIIIPSGVQEKAQLGLKFLKDAVVELINANQKGVTNAEIAKSLGLQSDFKGGARDYLSFSIIGLLLRAKQIKRESGSRRYTI